MPAPRISHQLEYGLYVADLDRAEAFYSRVFGFERFLRDHRMAALRVPGGSVLLLFLHGGSVAPARMRGGDIPPHDARGAQHLAFAIPPRELAAWEAHLGAEAVTVESRVTWPSASISLYFRDPDGHSLEVATPALWPNY